MCVRLYDEIKKNKTLMLSFIHKKIKIRKEYHKKSTTNWKKNYTKSIKKKRGEEYENPTHIKMSGLYDSF